MDKTSTNKTSEDQKLLEKAAEEKSEGLRLLFRNKYVQMEPAFWSNGEPHPSPELP